MILDEMKLEIENASRIAILTHVNPDGDAIGSSLGMYIALKNQNKDVDVIIPDHSRMYNFLPCCSEIKKEGTGEYDLVLALDCATKQRLADPTDVFDNTKTKLQIDHHISNSMYTDFDYVDHVAPACAQILINVLEYWGIEVTKEIGTCLLAGIITDTGGFRYDSVSAETFEIVANLLSKGINISSVYKRVFQIMSKSKFELNKLVTSRIEFFEDEKIAFAYVDFDELQKIGAETGDYEGCAEIGRDIEGVEVSIFLRGIETGGYKVSMRSNDYVNVSDICLMFGGGGHVKAAGCAITNGTLEQIRDRLIMETKAYLK